MNRSAQIAVISLASVAMTGWPGAAYAQEPPASSPVSPKPPAEVVWVDDALPAGAKTEGIWEWDTATVASGAKSHGHPAAKGLNSHGFTAEPVAFSANGMIVQQVWLDPQDPPKGIMLKFKLDTGEEVGVYWEAEEEVFKPAKDEETWFYGVLPELGRWSPLEVLAEDLGLEQEKIVGISFVTFDGRALWDKTVVTEVPAEPPVIVDDFPDFPKGPSAPGTEPEDQTNQQ